MRQAVMPNWDKFTTPIEGDHILWMYPDVKNFITYGNGNLGDPVEIALKQPWKNPDGSLASAAVVRAQWQRLKDLHLEQAGARSSAVRNATNIRLTAADVDALVTRQMLDNEVVLKKEFTNWDTYCADAQVGLFSMSWALGPAFVHVFGNLYKAVLAGDWLGAEAACKISEDHNAGVVPRNVANRLCFHNAAMVAEHGLDPDTLYWPNPAGDAVAVQADPDADLRRLANIALANQAAHVLEQAGHYGSDGINQDHTGDEEPGSAIA